MSGVSGCETPAPTLTPESQSTLRKLQPEREEKFPEVPWLWNGGWEDSPTVCAAPRLYHGLQALGQLIGFHRVLGLPAAAPVGGLGAVVHGLFCGTHRGQFPCQQSSGHSALPHTAMTWVRDNSKWHREKAKTPPSKAIILSDDVALSHYTFMTTKPPN